ncbi:hypothetical protein ACRYCC_06010 [Actinomadura scrupuli]|uniref:hypothetical protein n=1 Tax=Actinomadura scrupuli TaxID=559629 RepID=UPI003D99D24C
MVVTPSMVDVVRFAGGWLFDRVMAGWDVTVLTADRADSRPLRILGARAVDLERTLASPVRRPQPQAIAVGTDLYGSDERVRRMVLDALDARLVEVRLWGDRWPADLGDGVDPIRHRLSAAARAFKAQALAAAAVPVDSCDVTEVFRRSELRRPSGSA